MDEPANYACPTCGQPVAVTAARDEQIAACPSCGGEFTVPAATVETDDATARDEQLDGLRIRQLATARRAAYRARSYAVIAAAVCLVATGQFVWTVRTAPARHVVFAILSLAGCVYFARLSRRLHREATRSILPEPTTSPDFTPLGDGSDPWKKLEDVS